MNLASPVPTRDSKNPISDQDIINTAMNGIKRILNVCLKNKKQIKRFILTSSLASNYYRTDNHNKKVIIADNDEWSDIDGNDKIGAYAKSKTLSEKYLWNFLNNNNNPFEAVAINPCMVIGPLLTNKKPSSVDTIYAILNGTFPFLPRYCALFIDVRDVALCHINALKSKNANGNRYIIGNHPLWLKDVAILLNEKYGDDGYNISPPNE